MNPHRRLTWLIFAVCALLLIDGLGWVTWQVLRLERSERLARQDAQLQEAVRLALWRMDGMLSPIIAAESGRPYFQYRAFYPAARAYDQMWEPAEPGEVLVPSPLLSGAGEYIRLHFESTPEGWLSSPQAPDASLRDRLTAQSLPLADILAVERRLVQLNSILRGTRFGDDSTDGEVGRVSSKLGDALLPLNQAEQELRRYARQQSALAASGGGEEGQSESGPMAQTASEEDRSAAEFAARQQTIAKAQLRNELPESSTRDRNAADRDDAAQILAAGVPADTPTAADDAAAEGAGEADQLADALRETGSSDVVQGRFSPVWRTNPTTGQAELLFVRVVTVGGRELLQGFWIDWPALRADLLDSVRDLLPEADLEPVADLASARLTGSRPAGLTSAGRLLASVPAVLAPGATMHPDLTGLTPARLVLVVAWLAVAAAVVAIGLVLRASLALSERRGRFASAVTHELRTPLTTFCMYSQMLADGMVTDENRRAAYLSTLKRESERLATIVENVLVYTRTGNRGAGPAPQQVQRLLEVVVPLLEQRAEPTGMRVEVDADVPTGLAVAADAASLDRVLGNLLDNACKYAGDTADRRVTLRVRQVGRGVEFRVRDFGPGINPRERRRVFKPFARAHAHSDDGSSGLGLGLALARSVARSLGGDLRLAVPGGPGAEFVLWLPAVGADGASLGGPGNNPVPPSA